jgi:hypothetical protein
VSNFKYVIPSADLGAGTNPDTIVAVFAEYPDWAVRAFVEATDFGLVISAITIFSCELDVDEEDGFVRNIVPSKTVPATGLPARALRQITMGELLDEFRAFAKSTASDRVFDDFIPTITAERLRRVAGASPRRPGPRAGSEEEYALWAARYVEIARTNPHPIAALAKEHNVTRRFVKDKIDDARRRKGFITTAGTLGAPGKAGGRLTERAEKVLTRMGNESADRERV